MASDLLADSEAWNFDHLNKVQIGRENLDVRVFAERKDVVVRVKLKIVDVVSVCLDLVCDLVFSNQVEVALAITNHYSLGIPADLSQN